MMDLTNMGEVVIIAMVIGFIAIALILLVYILFLVNLKKMLDQVNPDNRMVPPANVFLMLIPIFSLVYGFILFPKISASLKNEYDLRGMILPGDGLKGLGNALAGLSLLGAILNYVRTPVNGIVSLAVLVIFIIYWVKSAQIKNQLMTGGTQTRSDLLD
jgi:hypothetical protein